MIKNPFTNDPDRAEIWQMLVERDILAFCQADWSMVANDFIETGFMGIDGGKIPIRIAGRLIIRHWKNTNSNGSDKQICLKTINGRKIRLRLFTN